MEQPPSADRAFRILVSVASVVVIIAGLRAAQAILVPFLVALFLAILLSPLLRWLRRRGLSPLTATFVATAGLLALGVLAALFVGSSIAGFVQNLPHYRHEIQSLRNSLLDWVGSFGFGLDLSALRQQSDFLRTDNALAWFGTVVGSLGDLFSDSLLILFTVIFLLAEAASFPAKLQGISQYAVESTLPRLIRITNDVRHYMVIKSWISLINGAAIALWCLGVGVKYPLLWGLLTFFTNYIPNIGVMISAIPCILVALLDRGWAGAALMLTGFLLVEFLTGYVIEPRWAGKDLGISTLVVFLSLVFWGWVLGPLGMLLSVPLTIAAKIALESDPATRWLAVLLSGEPESSSTHGGPS